MLRRAKPGPPKIGRRKGFAVKLSGEHWMCVHIAYAWARHTGKASPEMDELVPKLPAAEEPGPNITGVYYRQHPYYQVHTFRLGAADILPLAALFDYGATLPFQGSARTLKRWAGILRSIDPLDLLADSIR